MKKNILLLVIVIVAAFLRLYKLDQNPPSLYWDEASLGYNAFSILTQGVDEHGERFPITRFIAFGDYKPPGYIYAIVPAMAVFGVNEWAIRFPSAISGALMVIMTYFLAKRLFGWVDKGDRVNRGEWIGIIAAAMLAVSPWGLQLSRAAFEAHLAALFNVLGIITFIYFPKRRWLLPLSLVFFVASFYTFNANRIIAPLALLLLGTVYRGELWNAKKWLLTSIIIVSILMLPNVKYFQTRESRLRFQEVSIFNNLDIVVKANERIERSGNAVISKIVHNRRVYFFREFLKHYTDNFKGGFLFVIGDRNPRLSSQDIGMIYALELPFLIIGLLKLLVLLKIKEERRPALLLLGWMLIAPIPAGMARETPHILRMASILPTYQLVTAIGMVSFWKWIRQLREIWDIRGRSLSAIKLVGVATFMLAVTVSLYYYVHNYWVHYPRDWGGEWQYGYKQMVARVRKLESNYDGVVVTQDLGRPYIYFLLYNQVNPHEYVAGRDADRDWYGFWEVRSFGSYYFYNKQPQEDEKYLYVDLANRLPREKVIDTVKDLKGQVVFEIGER